MERKAYWRAGWLLLLGLIGCGRVTTASAPADPEPVAGGGGSPDATAGSAADDGGARSEGGTRSDGGTRPLVSANGVPIPTYDPRNTCEGLGLELVPCDEESACQSECACAGGADGVLPETCFGGSCIGALDCATYCALLPEAFDTAMSCVLEPFCLFDEDCGDERCVVTQANGHGSCKAGHANEPCNLDEHCVQRNCILLDGEYVGSCTAGLTESPCLLDEDCQDARRCVPPVLPPDTTNRVLGSCTDGRVGSPCAASDDCRAGYLCNDSERTCAPLPEEGPCQTGADCPLGFCSKLPGLEGCTTGEEGEACTDASQCLTPFCAASACSSGLAGRPCEDSSQCTTVLGCVIAHGVCSDGLLGDACGSLQPCQSGLRCRSSKCLSLLPAGSDCAENGDCLSDVCMPSDDPLRSHCL